LAYSAFFLPSAYKSHANVNQHCAVRLHIAGGEHLTATGMAAGSLACQSCHTATVLIGTLFLVLQWVGLWDGKSPSPV